MKKYNWEEDRFYSISEDEERLYSTGDSELDELLEKAFCEGYEYAQREFARPLGAQVKTAARHAKRNLTMATKGDFQLGKSMAMGEMSPEVVKDYITRNRFVRQTGKNPVTGRKISAKKMNQLSPQLSNTNMNAWERIDKAGTGATNTIFGWYPKS